MCVRRSSRCLHVPRLGLCNQTRGDVHSGRQAWPLPQAGRPGLTARAHGRPVGCPGVAPPAPPPADPAISPCWNPAGSWWFPVADLPSLAHANASFVTVDGDGTVPVECATADGFDAVERVGIRGDHRGLIAMQAGWDQVLTWLRSGTVLDAGERWNLVVSPDAAKTA